MSTPLTDKLNEAKSLLGEVLDAKFIPALEQAIGLVGRVEDEVEAEEES